jgi:transcriptional regulator with XRE-family HTH domain
VGKELGRTIRILRQAKSLKLGELAKRSRVSIPFLSLLESGEREPSLAVLRRIANVIGVPSEALVILGMGSETQLRMRDPETAQITRAISDLIKVETRLRRLLGSEQPDVERKRNRA